MPSELPVDPSGGVAYPAVIGGLFWRRHCPALSPEFCFRRSSVRKIDDLVRYAAASRRRVGRFLGAAAMILGLAVAAVANWFRTDPK